MPWAAALLLCGIAEHSLALADEKLAKQYAAEAVALYNESKDMEMSLEAQSQWVRVLRRAATVYGRCGMEARAEELLIEANGRTKQLANEGWHSDDRRHQKELGQIYHELHNT